MQREYITGRTHTLRIIHTRAIRDNPIILGAGATSIMTTKYHSKIPIWWKRCVSADNPSVRAQFSFRSDVIYTPPHARPQ